MDHLIACVFEALPLLCYILGIMGTAAFLSPWCPPWRPWTGCCFLERRRERRGANMTVPWQSRKEKAYITLEKRRRGK